MRIARRVVNTYLAGLSLAVVLICILSAMQIACVGDSTTIVTPTQTVTIPGPGVSIGTPTPAIPGGSSGPIATVGVGVFGSRCTPEVRNGTPVAMVVSSPKCQADITATPKDAAGNKISEVVHGPRCDWTNDNPNAVQVYVDGDNPFNAVLEANATGSANVCATVQGVKGCIVVKVG